MLKTGIFCLLLALAPAVAHAQELALDLKVNAGAGPGIIDVELFPSNPQSTSFRLSIRSATEERGVTTQTLLATVSNLLSGDSYTVSAVGLSLEGVITETSPEESILAP